MSHIDVVGLRGRLHRFQNSPVHQTHVGQDEEVDLEKQTTLSFRVWRLTPCRNPERMEEAHRGVMSPECVEDWDLCDGI